MKLRVMVNGANGKMGQEAVKAINADEELELVGTGLAGDDLGALITANNAQIVVDLTTAEVAVNNTMAILNAGAHPVVGTSGFLPEDLRLIKGRCDSLQRGAIIAPNFSIGAVLMMKCAQEVAKTLTNVEIIELHHDNKQDAPSQTAIKTADLIQQVRSEPIPPKPCTETITGARGADHHQIPIHSVRLPGMVAHQTVIFGGHSETLRIQHDSLNRACFMPGIILACKNVINFQSLVYGLENIL